MNNIEIRPLAQKWFSAATPVNYVGSYTTIGSGGNGVVTVSSVNDISTTSKIEAIVPDVASGGLSVAYANNKITVTLGTDESKAADATKNTALLVAAAIDALDGFIATASGTGATAIPSAVSEKAFTAGHWGTPCLQSGVALESSGTYYVCTEANNTTKNANWKSFTLSNI